MILGKIIGNVVSTIKLPVYQGYKILIVQPVNDKEEPQGKSILALDTVQAGVGDTVLVIDEGNSSRLIMNNSTAPVRTMIVGIVDAIRNKVENKVKGND
jgi:ethanolamine utilization protein EutN